MEKLGYTFKNPELLQLALTQSGADAVANNERLEFLGDRVLGLTVAEMLFTMFPSEAEGDLARRHAVLVSTDTLAHMAKVLNIGPAVRHGHMTANRTKHMLADAMEAVFGAIYMDGGFTVARDVIANLWHDLAAAPLVAPKDAKTKLQEYVQKVAPTGTLPVYEYMAPTGESHSPIFNVRVSALGKSAMGQGTSKKIASTAAATELLKILAI